MARSCRSSAFCIDNSLNLVDECLLPGFDLPPRRRHVEELGQVDLGELHLSPGLRGPFHRERVTGQRTRIALAPERPCVNELASLLLHRLQRDEWTCWPDARFL